MREGLLASFRNISWDRVIAAAPAVAQRAQALWQRVSGGAGKTLAVESPPTLNPELLAAIDVRIGPLQQRLGALDEESRASFEVVRSMAEQHTQMVQAVDLLLARTRLLLRVCLGLAATILALAALVLAK